MAINGFGSPSEIQALERSLVQRYGVKVTHVSADLSKPEQCRQVVQNAEAQMGAPMDILVNNAGIQHVSPLATFPEERWDAVIAINLSAAFHTSKACLPGMVERGFGRIINIASAHGKVASANKAAYVASKHGVVGLTKVTALEAAGTGVTANTICPGWLLTPLVVKQIEAVRLPARLHHHRPASFACVPCTRFSTLDALREYSHADMRAMHDVYWRSCACSAPR